MLGKFISEHYINEKVDIYCGPPSNFTGKVIGCADEVLTLESDDKTLIHVFIPHIIAIWKAK
jgi:hypothetical protein